MSNSEQAPGPEHMNITSGDQDDDLCLDAFLAA